MLVCSFQQLRSSRIIFCSVLSSLCKQDKALRQLPFLCCVLLLYFYCSCTAQGSHTNGVRLQKFFHTSFHFWKGTRYCSERKRTRYVVLEKAGKERCGAGKQMTFKIFCARKSLISFPTRYALHCSTHCTETLLRADSRLPYGKTGLERCEREFCLLCE